jgi:hypothetical protein
MSSASPETSESDVLVHAEELKLIRVERERLDAREVVAYERMASALARRLGHAVDAPRIPPATPQRVRGLGTRVAALLRERPDADTKWLVVQAYGADTPRNRRALSSTKNYLQRAGRLPSQRGAIVTK